ncbi:universal stress protein [Desulfopila aestuarii]|uniref:Nucleotide-binding universal stress protein, UspA family n=1 Tax=Desulfopila aestuarii DSM 18488 TaxID=1121416 RepID=A0A1M7Y739_9BACT|nr:universal stress protein [Desulfopila aestuarii]SHO48430.1 Nucleotide-binding universal stress protein, UspA family [Desulfopila aestuarii DSM 18488]
MSETPTRILIAVDGSNESLNVVRYVGASAQPAGTEVVLYTVLSKIPETFWDSGKDSLWGPKIEAARKWEKRQLDHAVGTINSAFQILTEHGFPPAQVTTKISPQLEGVARDIIAEARRQYDILVIGRGKSASMQDQVLGSVASKVIGSGPAPAIWLVGAKPISDRVLIAMDHSASALKVVRHGATVLNRKTNSITLFHAIRGIAAISPPEMADIFPRSYQEQLIRDAERDMQPVILQAEALLNELDIAPDRIATRIATGVRSRAASIIDEAQKEGCGTIVVGRRGVTEVSDFSMGRVTNKLVQLAKEQALCIVG